MEEPIIEINDNNEKSKFIQKIKIIGNKSSENHILNVISYLINNKNSFEEPMKPTDLELKLTTNSDISKINKLMFNLKLKNDSFNPKRDINKNIKKYKLITPEIEIKDEYYPKNNTLKEIIIDLMPNFHKNLVLDLSAFPFYHYNIEKKKLEKYNLKLKHNKFVLCLYCSGFNETKIKDILKIVSGLQFMNSIFDYFENIYVIFEETYKDKVLDLINNENLNKFILDNNNNDDEKKIKYIFNILSIYDNNDTIFNIFKEQNKFNPEYYFILDQNDEIISLSNKIDSAITKVYFLMNDLKNLTNKGEKNYADFLQEKKNKKINVFKQIIHFISKAKNLNYIFELKFDISFLCSTNEECSKIYFKKAKSINIEGKLRTKEYLYLKGLLDSIKKSNNNINYDLIELETINIDVDFNEMICTKCTKEIPGDKHFYYCYICKTKYCYECVKEQLKKKGREKFIDQKHNILFFKTRNKKDFINLDKIKLGKNRFSESTNDSQFSQGHSAVCNGCRGHFDKMARYVCLSCRPGLYISGGYIDYCQKCIEAMCRDENEKIHLENKAKQIISIDRNNFVMDHELENIHKHDEHIYLLLPLEYHIVDDPYNHY
jgi:hypothetical protein